jgi:uncharacterized protein (DUF2342 family)
MNAAGRDAFNRVWESPETLPTRAEVNDPPAWISRVLGAVDPSAPLGSPATA